MDNPSTRYWMQRQKDIFDEIMESLDNKGVSHIIAGLAVNVEQLNERIAAIELST